MQHSCMLQFQRIYAWSQPVQQSDTCHCIVFLGHHAMMSTAVLKDALLACSCDLRLGQCLAPYKVYGTPHMHIKYNEPKHDGSSDQN